MHQSRVRGRQHKNREEEEEEEEGKTSCGKRRRAANDKESNNRRVTEPRIFAGPKKQKGSDLAA